MKRAGRTALAWPSCLVVNGFKGQNERHRRAAGESHCRAGHRAVVCAGQELSTVGRLPSYIAGQSAAACVCTHCGMAAPPPRRGTHRGPAMGSPAGSPGIIARPPAASGSRSHHRSATCTCMVVSRGKRRVAWGGWPRCAARVASPPSLQRRRRHRSRPTQLLPVTPETTAIKGPHVCRQLTIQSSRRVYNISRQT